jgi:hypothetical protein
MKEKMIKASNEVSLCGEDGWQYSSKTYKSSASGIGSLIAEVRSCEL